MPNIIMADKPTGVKVTSYEIPNGVWSLDAAFANANIRLIAQNEILIWNNRGTIRQSSGSAAIKYGMAVVQSGAAKESKSTLKRMASVAAPDSSTPGVWSNFSDGYSIENGCYRCTNNAAVAPGNVIDFIQIPYNIGWGVSEV